MFAHLFGSSNIKCLVSWQSGSLKGRSWFKEVWTPLIQRKGCVGRSCFISCVLTGFLRRPSEASLHRTAVGVVSSTNSTFVLHFAGTDLSITADLLETRNSRSDEVRLVLHCLLKCVQVCLMRPHHTFSTHTDTVGILVGASCPIMHQLLHVRRVSCFL